MMYLKKRVKLPVGMEVGAVVGVLGDGCEEYTIKHIERDSVGDVLSISLSSGWREPLCKIYLLKGRCHSEAMEDKESWVKVAIGECDGCGSQFPDSCVYYRDEDDDPNSMYCKDCYEQKECVV